MSSTSPTSLPERSARQWTLALKRSSWSIGGSGCSSCVATTSPRSSERPIGGESSLSIRAVYPFSAWFIFASVERRGGSVVREDDPAGGRHQNADRSHD